MSDIVSGRAVVGFDGSDHSRRASDWAPARPLGVASGF